MKQHVKQLCAKPSAPSTAPLIRRRRGLRSEQFLHMGAVSEWTTLRFRSGAEHMNLPSPFFVVRKPNTQSLKSTAHGEFASGRSTALFARGKTVQGKHKTNRASVCHNITCFYFFNCFLLWQRLHGEFWKIVYANFVVMTSTHVLRGSN